MGMKRTQPQFWTEQDWEKEQPKFPWWCVLAIVLIPVILFLMGWIAANGQANNW